MKIGIEGLTFDSAHYTEGITDKCTNIHGHTFTVNVEIEGEKIDEKTGMILDFGELKNATRETLNEWDHKLLAPKSEADKIKTQGPFKLDLKIMKGNACTTENIAKEIAEDIHKKLNMPIKVKVYEGDNSYATYQIPE